MIKNTFSLLSLFIAKPYFLRFAQDSLLLQEEKDQSLKPRSFGDNLGNKYNGEEFNYQVNDAEAQNLIQRFLQWFFQTLRENFGINIPPEAMQFLEYLIYILMGGLVIYLLIRFFIGENVSSIFGKKPEGTIGINLSEDHIENLDLYALLQSALEKKDFRLAVRYQYLMALKVLSQQGIIDWNYEKTNLDYQREIRIPAVQQVFRDVSYLYDYIWYGEQQIDQLKYNAAKARFAALANQIS